MTISPSVIYYRIRNSFGENQNHRVHQLLSCSRISLPLSSLFLSFPHYPSIFPPASFSFCSIIKSLLSSLRPTHPLYSVFHFVIITDQNLHVQCASPLHAQYPCNQEPLSSLRPDPTDILKALRETADTTRGEVILVSLFLALNCSYFPFSLSFECQSTAFFRIDPFQIVFYVFFLCISRASRDQASYEIT